MSVVIWRALNESGTPLEGVTVRGESPTLGNWTAPPTDPCGYTFTELGPGDYNVTFSKPGYADAGYYPATIGGSSSVPISKALPRAVPPPQTWQSPKGAFCIPKALSIGRDLVTQWDPAFAVSDPFVQDTMMQNHLDRGHNSMLYQVSGWPYHRDYAEIALDPARTRMDLTKIHNRGLQTILIFDDTRWPDLSYLQPVADVTQDVVSCVMGIMEVNGVTQNADIVLDILVQTRKLWPAAKLGVHFTDLMQGESHGLVNFTDAVKLAQLNMLFFQGSGWKGEAGPTLALRDPKDIAARIADFTRRLGGPGMSNGDFWHTLSDGVVDTELYTTLTYRNWMTEQTSIDLHNRVMQEVPGKADGSFVSVPVTGYLDGGSL